MTRPKSYPPPLFLLLPFLILSSSTSASDSTLYTYFYQCLNSHTPTPPVKSILFTKSTNSNHYTTVLTSYIRNLRFTSLSTPKPSLIIKPLTPSHLTATVICARAHNNTLIKIRSGGHDFDGLSYTSTINPNFILLDLSNLRTININISSNTAYIQSGATLGELYFAIAQKSPTHGFPAGVCPTVGVGGHFTGGGYGNMIRKYGLSVDHIIDAEIVDVNGRILNRKSMGEDLFWAIRGGGGGSFGVILSYTVNLVQVPKTVTVFRIERFVKDDDNLTTELVYKWQSVMKEVDNNLFMRLLLQPVTVKNSAAAAATTTSKKKQLTVRVTFISLFLGDANQLMSVMNTVFPELGVKKSDCFEMSWIKSVLYWEDSDNYKVTPLTMLLNRTYNSNYLKRKSDYVVTPITRDGLNLLWKKLIELGKTGMVFNAYGGVMSKIPWDATPFPHRAGNLFKIQYSENWHEAGEEEDVRNLGLIRELYKFMEPYVSKSPRGAFLNYRDIDIGVTDGHASSSGYEQGKVYGDKYFLGNFDRLVRVKTKVDPDNFFRNEQSIPVRN